MRRRTRVAIGWLGAAAALLAGGPRPAAAADDLRFPLDAEGPGWQRVVVVPDGAKGAAASFRDPEARIDAGPCPVSSSEPFTLAASIRTTEPGFSTAVMARGGGEVGASLVVGREPGRVSFEAWSWERVRLVSRTRVDDGKWHRVEAPYDPKSRHAILLVDGRPEAWADLGEGGAPEASLRLGDNIGASQPFRGDLDEVEVLRRTTHAERFAGLAPVVPLDEKKASLARLRARLLPTSTPEPKDADAWAARRAAIRTGVQDALGLAPWPKRAPLEPRAHGSAEGAGFEVARVSWVAWPGPRATGWLWTPRPRRESRGPALLSPHGHWEGGAIDPVVQARAMRFAREGWVVLVPDSAHVEDVASGVSAIGVMTWNAVRAIDLLLERPDVDPSRIAVTGASGGAQQSMYLMALDDRIAAAAPICMISYFQGILMDDGAHCSCNHPPRVAAIADEPEIAAVFAPRPVLFGSVTGDWTSDFPERGLPEIRRVYRLLGADDDRLVSVHRTEGHNYGPGFRRAVYDFLDRLFVGRAGGGEEGLEPIPLDRLAALGPPPAQPDRVTLAREHVTRRPGAKDLREVAPTLPWAVARAELVDLGPAAEGSAWRRATVAGEDGVRVPMLFRDAPSAKSDAWAVVVAPYGTGSYLVDLPPWLDALPRVALVDPRFFGEWRPLAEAWRRNGLLLGRGEGYEAAHDIALACESLPGDRPVALVASEQAGVAALLAARISRRISTVIASDLGPRFAEDGNRVPLCPEILRLFDLPGLVASIEGPRRLVLGGVRSPSDYRSARDVRLTATDRILSTDDVAAALRDAR